ncbi:MAG: hypothetical protein J7M38_01710 [Armatimonadetes bacterium]|nr:hypothetical protein [Armatimonadota bacterium]
MKLAGGAITALALLVGFAVIFLMGEPAASLQTMAGEPFRSVLWEHRALDVLGQMLIILGGTFGVLVLTKERIET